MNIKKKMMMNSNKQSVIIPSENPSFFNEDDIVTQSSGTSQKASGSDRQKLLNAYYGHSPIENSEKSRIKEKCTFVVDWQMPDTH